MKKVKIIPAIMAVTVSLIMALTGCSDSGTTSNTGDISGETGTSVTLNSDDMFTNRDFETGFDESTATKITISDSNSNTSITKEGTYIISGSTSDGSITVDVDDTEKVQLVLNGVSVTSKTSAALYVKSADKVFVTTVKGTENTLANGGTFTAIDDNKIDGAVYSKDDITFNGEGTLTVISPAAHGIVGKDDVKFTSGTYKIDCKSHGVDANDSIRVANANVTITAGKDGLHCDNDEDTEKGFIYIESGTFNIDVDDDGIHAITTLQINSGTFTVKAAEGLEATVIIINDGTISIEASDDGINAAKKSTISTPTVQINGGKITIVMGKGDTDGIDSNGDIIINGGTIDITGNSSFDYDGKGVLNGGTVIVNGEEVTTLPNQFAGGGGGMGGPGGMGGNGNAPGGMRGRPGDNNADTITSATPNANGERPEMPNFNGDNSQRPEKPEFDGSNDAGGNRQKPSGKAGSKNSTQNNA